MHINECDKKASNWPLRNGSKMTQKTCLSFSFVCYVIVFLFSSCFCTACYGSASQLQISRGNNLVSLPCEIAVEQINRQADDATVIAFTWERDAYVATDTLMPGKGYFLITTQSFLLDIAPFCPDTETSEYKTDFNVGWNLAGNPYKETKYLSEIFTHNMEDIGFPSYVYSSTGFLKMLEDYQVDSYQGFWLYVNQPFEATWTVTNKGSCADGSMSHNGYCPDYWIVFEPIQCGLNPWEQNGESATLNENQVIESYYKLNYDIDILELGTCGYHEIICLACVCARGDIKYILVDDENAGKIVNANLLPKPGLDSVILADLIPADPNQPPCSSSF